MNTVPFKWSVSQWFNSESDLALAQFKGNVVVVSAFQMLCPGCVAHSIPQLKKLNEMAQQLPLTVIGLHTVFEHHRAMQPHALEAFIHEYRLTFPIGVDAYRENDTMPTTMRDWHMLGLPSDLLSADGLEFHGQLSFMKAGLRFADHITTVSPTYAQEITTPAFGCGLEGVMRSREGHISGILNGIDTDIWNPANDSAIAMRYDAAQLRGRKREQASADAADRECQVDRQSALVSATTVAATVPTQPMRRCAGIIPPRSSSGVRSPPSRPSGESPRRIRSR